MSRPGHPARAVRAVPLEHRASRTVPYEFGIFLDQTIKCVPRRRVADATASAYAGVCPLRARLTIHSRPCGVRRASWCRFTQLSSRMLKLQQLQLPRPEPDGQRIESSQLERYNDRLRGSLHVDAAPRRRKVRERVGTAELLVDAGRRELLGLPFGNIELRQEEAEPLAAGVDCPDQQNRDQRAAAV